MHFRATTIKVGLILCVILISISSVTGGLRKDLENRRKKLVKEINEIKVLLSNTKKEKTATLDEYKTLNAQIEKRQELVATIKAEIEAIETNITTSQEQITQLKSDLKRFKGDYANMMRHAYRHRNANKRLLFVLSATNFNDAMRRWQYFVRYDQQRKRQIVLVGETQQELNKKIASLSTKRDEQQELLAENETQQEELTKEIEEVDELLKKLQEKEVEIALDLEKKNIAKARLTDAIDNAIRQDQKTARANARAHNKTVSTKNLSSSDRKINSSFASSKGKLPKPVSGVIISKYGVRKHPTLKSVTVKNNGIDIKTKANSSVKAVYNGVVVNVFSIPSSQEAVMIKHGNYYTVYSNLSKVSVKKGQKINQSTVIGTVGVDTQSKQSILHFEVWKGSKHMNPSAWLKK